MIDAVGRESWEEVGLDIDPGAVRLVHVVHHTDAPVVGAPDRVGFFFEADPVEGEPVNAEPHQCSELVWVDPHNLPDDVVPSRPPC